MRDRTTGRATVPNSVFILMNMDPQDDALADVHGAIRAACVEFGLEASRVDDIEHQDRITDRILERIATAEFIVADLSGEKPNVYYEVGYAHALGKRPILVRRSGTRLHFDLIVHNVPEYRNITGLRELLRRRLEAILGRSAASTT
jgi:nucleoside 2-deoxyribosyltransferase